jgi:hypothetical protein
MCGMSGSQPNLERILASPSFPDDTGDADPAVVAALAAHDGDPTSYALTLGALQATRLLVPVVALLGEVEYDERGLARDKTSDMAAVLLTGRDGRLALLAFTRTETMRRWDPEARPVPVATQLAAQSALQNQAAALLVDVAGPHTFVIEGDDLEAVARGWTPAKVGGSVAWIRPAGE